MQHGSDIMISFHPDDSLLKDFLKSNLERAGFTVFAVNLSEVSKRVEGVISCKIFVILLSPASASEKLCQDETSLAYISNKAIFPVATADFPEIAGLLDFGLRLTLAKINWTFFKEPQEYEESFVALRASLLHQFTLIQQTKDISGSLQVSEELEKGEYKFQTNRKRSTSPTVQISAQSFWTNNFQSYKAVSFDAIWTALLNDYGASLKHHFNSEKEIHWLRNLLYKEGFGQSKVISKSQYMKFCGSEGKDSQSSSSFYERVIDYAIGNLAMTDVFSMSSIVRLDAIRNLASFKNTAVIGSLLDLLADSDANMRAVAAISLSKIGEGSQQVISGLIACIDDEDRLVREAAVLSLGKMRCEVAIPRIMETWRNDPIAPVRAAAEIALQQMEVAATQDARKMVNLITKEIADLKQQNK